MSMILNMSNCFKSRTMILQENTKFHFDTVHLKQQEHTSEAAQPEAGVILRSVEMTFAWICFEKSEWKHSPRGKHRRNDRKGRENSANKRERKQERGKRKIYRSSLSISPSVSRDGHKSCGKQWDETKSWLTSVQPSATSFRKGHCYVWDYQCGFSDGSVSL